MRLTHAEKEWRWAVQFLENEGCDYQFRKVDGEWQRRRRKPDSRQYNQWRTLVVRKSKRPRGAESNRVFWTWR